MSATIGAALKKIAVSLLLDKRNWEKVACILVAFFALFILPGAGVASMFSREDVDFTMPGMVDEVIANLTPEEVSELQFVEDTVNALHTAMTGRTPEQIKAAEVLYILALSEYAKEPEFVAKLAGCFSDGQTDEQLIAAVNAAFGTNLDPDDFSAIMNYANHQLVEIAKSQLGNVDGEPYWSWYGFPGRVEWCACFVSWCANKCGYLDKGIIPRFSGCDTGIDRFKDTGHNVKYVEISDQEQYDFFDSIGVPRTTEEMWAQTATNFPFCSDGMVTFGRAIRQGQMATFTKDFEELTGQKPITVRRIFEEMESHLIGSRTSTDK